MVDTHHRQSSSMVDRYRNQLLACLPAAAWKQVESTLAWVDLLSGTVLYRDNANP
jgi:hypothetical protein